MVALALCALCRRRFEVLLPGFAGGLILVCYLLALFQGLGLFPWLSYLAALAALGWMLAQALTAGAGSWAKPGPRLTPGLAAFGLLALLFILTMGEHVVWATDDLYYWAVQVKGCHAQQGLVDASITSPPVHDLYPGMQLFQWIGVAMAGEFSEGTLYMSLALFYAVFCCPLARDHLAQGLLSAASSGVLPGGSHGLPTPTPCSVDTALGVCLGSALCQAWSLGKKASWVDCAILALTLTTLVLVKQVGAFWACCPWRCCFGPKGRAPCPSGFSWWACPWRLWEAGTSLLMWRGSPGSICGT